MTRFKTIYSTRDPFRKAHPSIHQSGLSIHPKRVSVCTSLQESTLTGLREAQLFATPVDPSNIKRDLTYQSQLPFACEDPIIRSHSIAVKRSVFYSCTPREKAFPQVSMPIKAFSRPFASDQFLLVPQPIPVPRKTIKIIHVYPHLNRK